MKDYEGFFVLPSDAQFLLFLFRQPAETADKDPTAWFQLG
jgi:hypothetical protein